MPVHAGQGGSQVILEVDCIAVEGASCRDTTSRAADVLRRRLAEMDWSASAIRSEGAGRIVVDFANASPSDHTLDLLTRFGQLGFRMVDETVPPSPVPPEHLPTGSELLPSYETGPDGRPALWYGVHRDVLLDGDSLVNAQLEYLQGQPVVLFELDPAGTSRFGEVTEAAVGRQLAIVFDGKVLSAPLITNPIAGGRGLISGGFTMEQARDLALTLRAGALPAPVSVLKVHTPDAADENLDGGKAPSLN